MRRRSYAVLLLIGMGLFLPGADATAFNGHRAGFQLGFGAGYGSLFRVTESPSQFPYQGVATDLIIGLGITDQWTIQYRGRQLWLYKYGVFISPVYPSAGLSYYLKPTAPSLFFTGSVGAGGTAVLIPGYGGGFAESLGPAVFLGAGYEFSPHFGLELAFGASRPPGSQSYYGDLALTLHTIAY